MRLTNDKIDQSDKRLPTKHKAQYIYDFHLRKIPYKWKHWRVLNLANWFQTGHSKILAELTFGGGRKLACKVRLVLIYLAEFNLAIPAPIAKPPN